MQIKAEEISKIIEDQIQNYEQRVEMSETGTVLYVGDGIARVYGVKNAMSMELLEFPGGIMGMVLNLEEDNVGVALLGKEVGDEITVNAPRGRINYEIIDIQFKKKTA